jgi:hypothetical protein
MHLCLNRPPQPPRRTRGSHAEYECGANPHTHAHTQDVLLDTLVLPSLPVVDYRSDIHGIKSADLQAVRCVWVCVCMYVRTHVCMYVRRHLGAFLRCLPVLCVHVRACMCVCMT